MHSWENFAASGSAAGLGVALWMIRPIKLRPLAFGVMLGGLLGGAGAAAQQVRCFCLGVNVWEGRDMLLGLDGLETADCSQGISNPLSGTSFHSVQSLGAPFWDEAHDFEGWFLVSVFFRYRYVFFLYASS